MKYLIAIVVLGMIIYGGFIYIISTRKSNNKSYLRNCYIKPKDGEDLFFINKKGEALASLDGYAVVPLDHYNDLIDKLNYRTNYYKWLEDYKDTLMKYVDLEQYLYNETGPGYPIEIKEDYYYRLSPDKKEEWDQAMLDNKRKHHEKMMQD